MLDEIKPGDPIWVQTDGWAGRMKWRAIMVKVNPKRSRVRYLEKYRDEMSVPNYAITARRETDAHE